MWGSEMMGYGGWMLFWALGGLFIFGAVIYAAVRMGSHYARRDGYGYYGGSPRSHDCHGDNYYDGNDRRMRDDGHYWGDPR